MDEEPWENLGIARWTHRPPPPASVAPSRALSPLACRHATCIDTTIFEIVSCPWIIFAPEEVGKNDPFETYESQKRIVE